MSAGREISASVVEAIIGSTGLAIVDEIVQTERKKKMKFLCDLQRGKGSHVMRGLPPHHPTEPAKKIRSSEQAPQFPNSFCSRLNERVYNDTNQCRLSPVEPLVSLHQQAT